MSTEKDPDFSNRRQWALEFVNKLDADSIGEQPGREGFFGQVYEKANGDAAMVPWADMEPKQQLLQWLEGKNGGGLTALEVGCGLGDNAEAVAAAGYQVTAFDFQPEAIEWARNRFPDSPVDYQVADLFNVPRKWVNAFDLVFECYTLQSIPPQTLERSMPAIASMVAPGGTLLIYTRIRNDGEEISGPPWPLEESSTQAFLEFGLEPIDIKEFELERRGNMRRHQFSEWRKKR